MIIHPLTDDRRRLPIEKRGTVIEAPPEGDEPAAAESEAEAPGEEVPAGARIPVRGFRIQGIVERPEYGIERAGIEAIGHSGPAGWCYLVVYGTVVALLVIVVWSRRMGRRRPADHAA